MIKSIKEYFKRRRFVKALDRVGDLIEKDLDERAKEPKDEGIGVELLVELYDLLMEEKDREDFILGLSGVDDKSLDEVMDRRENVRKMKEIIGAHYELSENKILKSTENMNDGKGCFRRRK